MQFFFSGLTIHTENEENEILYPNSDYCKNLKNWTKYSLSHDGLKKLDGFQNRQEEIYRTLAINYQEKPNVAVHLRDIVVTMRVSHFLFCYYYCDFLGAVVAQLASAWLSEREVSGSIFNDFNVCFDFPLIRVAIALNTRKTEH